MRTLEEIKSSMERAFLANAVLRRAYGLNDSPLASQLSAVSIEMQLLALTAQAVYDHEFLMEQEMKAIEQTIEAKIPFSPQWYQQKALEFQFGSSLAFDSASCRFAYPETIEERQIVQYAAIRESVADSVTVLNVYAAKTGKAPLSAAEKAAFEAYIREIGAAGTHFNFISATPVGVDIDCRVYYDPQILDSNGKHLSGTDRPIEAAIAGYVDSIPYTGRFSVTRCQEYIRQADGVTEVGTLTASVNGTDRGDLFYSDSGFFSVQTVTVTFIAKNSED
jgi:hypothetical protein